MSVTGAGSRRQPLEERRQRDVAWTPGPRRSGRPSGPAGARHRSSPSNTLGIGRAGTAPAETAPAMAARDLLAARARCPPGTPAAPSEPVPSGSVVRSMSTRPGERERDHQRRRGEVAGPHQGMDAALEVAVARQDRGDHQVVVLDRPGRRARRAGRCCRCRWCSRSPRGRSRALAAAPCRPARSRYSVTAREPGARLVLTVGAAPSGPGRPRCGPAGPHPPSRVGLEVLVQLVMAAMATEPVRTVAVPPSVDTSPVDRRAHRWIGAPPGQRACPATSTGSAPRTPAGRSPGTTPGCHLHDGHGRLELRHRR